MKRIFAFAAALSVMCGYAGSTYQVAADKFEFANAEINGQTARTVTLTAADDKEYISRMAITADKTTAAAGEDITITTNIQSDGFNSIEYKLNSPLELIDNGTKADEYSDYVLDNDCIDALLDNKGYCAGAVLFKLSDDKCVYSGSLYSYTFTIPDDAVTGDTYYFGFDTCTVDEKVVDYSGVEITVANLEESSSEPDNNHKSEMTITADKTTAEAGEDVIITTNIQSEGFNSIEYKLNSPLEIIDNGTKSDKYSDYVLDNDCIDALLDNKGYCAGALLFQLSDDKCAYSGSLYSYTFTIPDDAVTGDTYYFSFDICTVDKKDVDYSGVEITVVNPEESSSEPDNDIKYKSEMTITADKTTAAVGEDVTITTNIQSEGFNSIEYKLNSPLEIIKNGRKSSNYIDSVADADCFDTLIDDKGHCFGTETFSDGGKFIYTGSLYSYVVTIPADARTGDVYYFGFDICTVDKKDVNYSGIEVTVVNPEESSSETESSSAVDNSSIAESSSAADNSSIAESSSATENSSAADNSSIAESSSAAENSSVAESSSAAENSSVAESSAEVQDSTPTAEQTAAIGDVDGNGIIETSDALLVLKQVVGLENFDDNSIKAADTDKNNIIDTGDALNILKFVVGLIEKFRL